MRLFSRLFEFSQFLNTAAIRFIYNVVHNIIRVYQYALFYIRITSIIIIYRRTY